MMNERAGRLLYTLLRKGLFALPAEYAHRLALQALQWSDRLRLIQHLWSTPKLDQPVELLGLRFLNRVGLAAGLDKNADFIDALGALGFGFIEVGTVTPRPQLGNPKPRLFRLMPEQALINRMGFNNKGVDYLVERLKKTRYRGVVGVNIGKNKSTPIDQAVEDYIYCVRKVYEWADYIVVNVSSPNTPDLRSLQFGDYFAHFLGVLKREQQVYQGVFGKQVPFLVKISPDLTLDELSLMAQHIKNSGIEGVIATNTTVSRSGVEQNVLAAEEGGLSGSPVKVQADAVLKQLRSTLAVDQVVIGVGGIQSAQDACDKIKLGADLVQLYTGFIYQGPSLVKACIEQLSVLKSD